MPDDSPRGRWHWHCNFYVSSNPDRSLKINLPLGFDRLGWADMIKAQGLDSVAIIRQPGSPPGAAGACNNPTCSVITGPGLVSLLEDWSNDRLPPEERKVGDGA